jgi:cell division protein FtsL
MSILVIHLPRDKMVEVNHKENQSMNPQDNNTQFTGISQNESISTSQGDGTKGWKITAIIAIIAVIGLTAGLVFFALKTKNLNNDIKDLQANLNATNVVLNKFKEATGVSNPEDFVSGTVNIGSSTFFDAMTAADIIGNISLSLIKSGTGASFIKTSADGNFQIASLGATTESVPGEWIAYFYRSLPDGEWVFSNFSGLSLPLCSDITQEEIAAFDGIVECIIRNGQ